MEFYDKFEKLCHELGISPTKAARDMGIAQQSVSLWKKRGSTPSGENLQKIAKFFGVTVDYLLDKDQQEKDRHFPFNQTSIDFFNKIHSLNKSDFSETDLGIAMLLVQITESVKFKDSAKNIEILYNLFKDLKSAPSGEIEEIINFGRDADILGK